MNRLLIGLTGNIATGKSVIRRMLVNHGALGLDADLIAHRTLYPGGKAYQAVINTFGSEILTPQNDISRAKLGATVFTAPDHLAALEALIHPAVTADIEERIQRATLPIVVIEAIKLLETPLAGLCQSVWISQASPAHQMERLLHARNMSEELARQRIEAQTPQAEKRQHANVVINTEGNFLGTWRQVHQALNDTIQSAGALPAPYINIDQKFTMHPAGSIPQDALEAFWQANACKEAEDLYERLAFDVVQVITDRDRILAILICEDWNFTSTLKSVIFTKDCSLPIEVILQAFQQSAGARQSELLILSDPILNLWKKSTAISDFGFQRQAAQDLTFPAWQQAVQKQSGSSERQLRVKTIAQNIE